MRRFWNRKGQAAKKWRSKAWCIDPKETKITIIKGVSCTNVSEDHMELVDLDIEELASSLFFPIKKPTRLIDSCNRGAGALLDME